MARTDASAQSLSDDPADPLSDWPPTADAPDSAAATSTGQHLSGFRNGDLFFDVIDSGPRDGEPVVLLHGFPQTATSWNAVTNLLNQRGLRTVAPHQRGYSPNARPRGRLAYRLPHLVDDTVRLLDAIGEPVHLVGHDWGAVVAWLTAAQHPDRVRSLTSVSVPHPGAFLRSMLTSKQALRSYYMGVFQLPFLPELVLRMLPSVADRMLAGVGMTASQRETTRREIIQAGALTGALNWYRAMPLVSPRTMGGRVAVPTTHVWSDRDVALDRKGAELTSRYVTAPFNLVVLPGVSHWVPEQQPETLAGIIASAARQINP